MALTTATETDSELETYVKRLLASLESNVEDDEEL
jgi:hypothetical protein